MRKSVVTVLQDRGIPATLADLIFLYASVIPMANHYACYLPNLKAHFFCELDPAQEVDSLGIFLRRGFVILHHHEGHIGGEVCWSEAVHFNWARNGSKCEVCSRPAVAIFAAAGALSLCVDCWHDPQSLLWLGDPCEARSVRDLPQMPFVPVNPERREWGCPRARWHWRHQNHAPPCTCHS